MNGNAWMLNKWSHEYESPPRTDVYVMAPHTLEIVNQFNLLRPYLYSGAIGEDGAVYIYHMVHFSREFDEGLSVGVSRVDPNTLQSDFTATERKTNHAYAIGVYRNRPCIPAGDAGLRCLNGDGTTTLVIDQENTTSVLFSPAGSK